MFPVSLWWQAGMHPKITAQGGGVAATQKQLMQGRHGHSIRCSRGACPNRRLQQSSCGTIQCRARQKVQELHMRALCSSPSDCGSLSILELVLCSGGQAALGRRGWDSSRPSTPGVGREAPPARGEWGMPRRGAQQQRALRLTHRERVKLMLESNRRIKLACAAVEVWQSACMWISSPGKALVHADDLCGCARWGRYVKLLSCHRRRCRRVAKKTSSRQPCRALWPTWPVLWRTGRATSTA